MCLCHWIHYIFLVMGWWGRSWYNAYFLNKIFLESDSFWILRFITKFSYSWCQLSLKMDENSHMYRWKVQFYSKVGWMSKDLLHNELHCCHYGKSPWSKKALISICQKASRKCVHIKGFTLIWMEYIEFWITFVLKNTWKMKISKKWDLSVCWAIIVEEMIHAKLPYIRASVLFCLSLGYKSLWLCNRWKCP